MLGNISRWRSDNPKNWSESVMEYAKYVRDAMGRGEGDAGVSESGGFPLSPPISRADHPPPQMVGHVRGYFGGQIAAVCATSPSVHHPLADTHVLAAILICNLKATLHTHSKLPHEYHIIRAHTQPPPRHTIPTHTRSNLNKSVAIYEQLTASGVRPIASSCTHTLMHSCALQVPRHHVIMHADIDVHTHAYITWP